AGKLAKLDPACRREPMFRRHDNDIAFRIERQDCEVAAIFLQRVEDGDVKLAVPQATADIRDTAFLDCHLDGLEIALELGQETRQADMANSRKNAEADWRVADQPEIGSKSPRRL